MSLVELLNPSLIKVPLEGLTKDEVIAELVEEMVRAGKVTDRDGVLQALFERELKGSTGIGDGVAVPHARHASMEGAVLAVGIAADGIEFEAVDDEPVHLVFLLMASSEKPEEAVNVLADIGLLAQVPGVYDKLIAARSAQDVIGVIEKAQEEEWAIPSSDS